MSNKVVAWTATHMSNQDEVTFVVVTSNVAQSGWQLLAKFGEVMERYHPLRSQIICERSDQPEQVVGVFGPARSVPKL